MPRERQKDDDAALIVTAKAIRRLRKERGLSQEDLAELAGLSPHMIYLLERVTPPGNPRLATLHRLAASLNVSVTELIDPDS